MAQYELFCGDTHLGVLTRYEMDWPWTFCQFVADPPFAGIQPLFEESFRLLKARDRQAWAKVYEQIEALDLFLRDAAGRRGKPWRLHIHDQRAWFRLCVPYWQQ